jgi:hypothetical protein
MIARRLRRLRVLFFSPRGRPIFRRLRRRASYSPCSFAKRIAPQRDLVDCDGRLRAFPYGNRDKKDVARHITCNIPPGTLLSSVSGSIRTPPFALRLQPRRLDRSDA